MLNFKRLLKITQIFVLLEFESYQTETTQFQYMLPTATHKKQEVFWGYGEQNSTNSE